MKHTRKSTWGKKILSVAMSLVFAIGVVAMHAPATTFASSNWSGVSPQSWMSHISDSTHISEINIPGTHDSGTRFVDTSLWAQTQDETIPDQLNAGVRFLDIRLDYRTTGGYTDLLKVVHGTDCTCYETDGGGILYFNKVIEWCHNFLVAHPSETIIMSVKLDGNSKNGNTYFSQRVYSYINQNPSWWYLQNGNPTLGDVRGKIVLFRRFTTHVSNPVQQGGLDINFADMGSRSGNEYYKTGTLWTINNIYYNVQDYYNLNRSTKWSVVKHNLDNSSIRAASNRYVINFLSSFSVLTPRYISSYVNDKFMDYNLTQGTKYGWILFDHVEVKHARHVYESNIRSN